MIDSHAHIYLEEFDEDLDDVLDVSADQGVKAILMPNIDHTSIERMLRVEEKDPTRYPSMMGLHPCSVKKDFEKELYLVEEWLSRREFIAVGEIGTDLYWDKSFWSQQQEALKIQMEMALNHDLPVVLHCRDSIDETIEIVRPFSRKGLRGVFHCFTGTEEQANQIKELGFNLGIGGVSTFKNGGLDKVLEKIGSDKILLETDSPYLAPVPYRGKRNQPSYLNNILERLAVIFNSTKEDIEDLTDKNTIELFKLNGL